MNKPDDWFEEYSLKPEELKLPDKWILSQLNKAIEMYNHQLERFHFNEAAKVLYDYIWNDFCDWYIEIAKTRFYSEDIDSKMMTYNICISSIRKTVALLHPYTPFITEKIWTTFSHPNEKLLISSNWPEVDPENNNNEVENEMNINAAIVLKLKIPLLKLDPTLSLLTIFLIILI